MDSPPPLAQFYDEILAQPKVLAEISEHWEQPHALPHSLKECLPSITHILGLGEGSSLHALHIVQPWLTQLTGCPCRINTAYQGQRLAETLHHHEGQQIRPLVIIVSQSGQTSSLLLAIHHLPDDWPVLVVTNTPQSPLTQHPRTLATLMVSAGNEVCIPATKTVSATVATLLGFGHQWARLMDKPHPKALSTSQWTHGLTGMLRLLTNHQAPLSLSTLPHQPNPTIHQWAEDWIQTIQGPVVLLGPEGWRPLLAEIRLKWMETLGLVVIADSLEGFLHGPRAICSPQINLPPPHILVWLPKQGPSIPSLPEPLHQTLRSTNASVSVLLIDEATNHGAGVEIMTITDLPTTQHHTGITSYQPAPLGQGLGLGQWLAWKFCQTLTINPNHPLLTKAVTNTKSSP